MVFRGNIWGFVVEIGEIYIVEGEVLRFMKKKNLVIWLGILLIATQFANAMGFYSQVNADGTGSEITDNIVTSVTLAVYEQGTQVTSNVYKLDSTVKMKLTYQLPDDTDDVKYLEGATYTYELPHQLAIDHSYSGPLVFGDYEDGIGTYSVGTDNKVVFTFNKNIEGLMSRGGTFWVESTLSSTKVTGSTEQTLSLPVTGNASNSITLNVQPLNGAAITKAGKRLPQDYNPDSIEWTVDVNTSLSTINNAVVTDALQAGLELDISSIAVYNLNVDVLGNLTQGGQVSAGQYDTSASDPANLELKFGNTINEAYRVKFTTKITNEATASFTNKAVIKGNGINQNASATLGIVRGKPLEKNYTGYDASSEAITWEIKYNYNEKEIASDDAVLTDYFNKSQVYVPASMAIYKVTLDQNGNEIAADLIPSNEYSVNSLPLKDGKVGFTLKFINDIHSAYRIEYKTKVADRLYADENIVNKVTASTYSDDASYTITQRILNKKAVETADVDYLNKTVKWTVTVNEDKRTMTHLVLTDVFDNAGLQLVGTPVITPDPGVDGISYQITDIGSRDFSAGDGFTIEFLNPITKTYTITYTTKFDYYKLSSGKSDFPNTASIVWDEKTTPVTDVQESSQTFDPRSEVKKNGIKTGTYDAVAKKITWSVGANYNKRQLSTGAELVDTLPAGQQMAGGTTVTVAVYKMNYAANGNPTRGVLVDAGDYEASMSTDGLKLKVKFLTAVDYSFYVVFQTEFSDEDVDQTTVTNTAILNNASGNPVSQTLSGKATVPKGGEYVSKAGTQDSSDQTLMNWIVTINANQSVVSQVEIVDTPSTNQVLLPASFKVIEAAVATNGAVSETAAILAPENYTVEFLTDNNGNDSFKLKFKNTIAKAYILKYQSVITAVGSVSLTNAVSFSGESTKKVTKDITSTSSVSVADTGGTGSGFKGSLKVLKTNADGSEKLAGAEFSLYRLVGTELKDKKDDTSDTNGGLEFTELRAGKYILKETKAPAGYALDTTEHAITINSATPVLLTVINDFNGSLNITKVEQGNSTKKLEGAEFELYDSTDTLVKSGTTGASGSLSFTKLKGGNYTLKEIKAPDGYKLNTTTSYAFTIDPAQEKIMEISNTKIIIGSLKLTKVAEEDSSKKLEGAEFTLYDSSNQIAATGNTDVNGELEFTDLTEGSYLLKETGAPEGYELNSTEFPVTIDSAVQKVLTPITNKEILGSLKFVKVDQDDVTKKLAGAEFKLYDLDGNVIRTGTTEIITGELEFTDLKLGSYVLKETSAPAGYELNKSEYPVKIDSKVQQVLDPIRNQETLGSIKLVKVEQGNEAKKLAGAEFTLYDAAQHVVKTGTTDAAGELEFKDLKLGSYVLKETRAPAGYELNAAEYPVTIDSEVQQVLDPIKNKVRAATTGPVAVPTTSPAASQTAAPTATPGPSASATPGVTATASPTPTPAATPALPAASSTPAAPQATAVTTVEDIPINGEIPLGGIPSISEQPEHGKVVLTPDGKWTYTPEPGYTGKDKFTITVTDEDGNDQDVVIEIDVDEVPRGTVTDTASDDGGLPGMLPKTGEQSPLPL